MVKLFFIFFKIGLFTFGGGWAMLALIEREVVTRYGWLTEEEFIDALTVAQSMPGVLAVNIAILVGRKVNGMVGSIVATAGSVLPSFILILLIAVFFRKIYTEPWVERIFRGIRPAVVALIVAPVISTARKAGLNRYTWWIPIATALAIGWGDLSPVLFVAFGLLGGIVSAFFITPEKSKS